MGTPVSLGLAFRRGRLGLPVTGCRKKKKRAHAGALRQLDVQWGKGPSLFGGTSRCADAQERVSDVDQLVRMSFVLKGRPMKTDMCPPRLSE